MPECVGAKAGGAGMSIRQRVFVVITGLNLVVVLCGAVGGIGMYLSNLSFQSVYVDRVIPMRQLKDVSDTYSIHVESVIHKGVSGQITLETVKQELARLGESGMTAWKAYTSTYLTPEEALLVKEVDAVLLATQQALNDALRAAERAPNGLEVLEKESQAIDSDLEKLGVQLNALVTLQMDVAKQEFDSSQKRFSILLYGLIALTLASGLGGFLAGRSLREAISGLLTLISENLDELAVGNVASDVPAKVQSESGEVGTIGTALQSVRSNIREIVRNLVRQSDALAAASEELTATSKELSSNTEQIHGSLSEVSSASTQLSQTVDALAQSAQHISSQGQTVASAVEQMSASITEVSRNCTRESVIARQADERTQETRKLMERLQEAANEVGKIVGVIADVARQTNLLALNAAIEAATAGVAGRGFAVVANEVKELAKESAAAAERIAGQIEQMRSATRDAMSGIQELSGVNQEVNAIAQAIAAAVEQQTVTVHEISRNMLMQTQAITRVSTDIQSVAGGTGVVTKNIGSVGQQAESVAASATETNVSAGELSSMAGQLMTVVRRFKV